MEIKVLHVVAPSYPYRFSGDVIRWKYNFEHWNYPQVVHVVLDCAKNRLMDSKEVFNITYTDKQKRTSRWARIAWIFSLFYNLHKFKGQYDLVHVHVLWWGGLLIGPWAKIYKIPAIYESVLLDSDTPGGISKEKNFARLKISCLKSYRAILAISKYLADDYLLFGFSQRQVATIMSCVDQDLFKPVDTTEIKRLLRQRLNLPPTATILLFVGSVNERKGVDLLVQAFIQAYKENPNLFLLIIGPINKRENPSIDEKFVNALFTLLETEHLKERVYFSGMIQDRKKMAEIYQAADVFVFPSHREGLPNVILEAMATGLPVVVSRLPVLENIIQDRENGFMIRPGDVEAITDAILTLSADYSLMEKLGNCAHAYIQEKHSFVYWQSRMVEFYKGLVSA